MDISTLSIDRAIIHEITDKVLAPPKAPELILSNALSPLDRDLRGYFQERIAVSLDRAAYRVVAVPDSESPTPELVHAFFTDQSLDFVQMSHAVAEHLFAAQQTVRSSPGLLVIASGTADSGACLAILKLQKQEGLHLERVGDEGAETYSLEHLKRLMLTNDTRVFKVALFEADGVVDVEDIQALVSDKQRYSSPEKRMADFFLNTFLGCRLREDPAQTTSRYYVTTEKYINDHVADPEKRARYHRALLTDLTSQAMQVDPRGFAQTHIDDSDRQAFLGFLKDEGVTVARFNRDTELIDSRLKEEEYVLDSGIHVRGRPTAFDEHAKISTDGDVFEMFLQDRLSSVKGAPSRRR